MVAYMNATTTPSADPYQTKTRRMYRAYAAGFAVDAQETGNSAVQMARGFCDRNGGYDYKTMLWHVDSILQDLEIDGEVTV
jgi:hypothetical protein